MPCSRSRSSSGPPAHGRCAHLLIRGLVLAIPFAFIGCGGGGGGGGGGGTAPPASTSPSIDYNKYRDFSVFPTGDLSPVLAESGADFDSDEVDGPAIAVDKSRPAGDFFLIYYEATDAAGDNTIGLISSTEEDLQDPIINRVQVIDPSLDGGLEAFDVGATDPTVVVDKRASTPAGERYKMWFEGRSGPHGNDSTIVYCVSGDGVAWSNFTICNGLTAGSQVTFGDRVADPTVLLDQGAGGDRFRMWFEALDDGSDGSARIGYADSTNGVDWTVRDAAGGIAGAAGPVIAPGFGGAFSNFSVGSPSVFLVENPINDANIAYHIWYTGGDVATALGTEDSIGYATSADGLVWVPEASLNPSGLPVLAPTSDSILDPSSGGFERDSGDVRQPCGWIDTDLAPTTPGAYLLWYAADIENGGPNSPNRIGFAKGNN